jgi:hypothetical protein
MSTFVPPASPVIGQAAAAVLVEEPEIDLRVCVSLFCGELEKARGLAVVLRNTAKAVPVVDPQIVLSAWESLFCGELARQGVTRCACSV